MSDEEDIVPPLSIDRETVRRLMTEGAQVLEVLPAQAYDKEHLAGAISFPLARLGREARQRLATDQAIVVYCHDYQ
jgi:rhodanese-related sulfurtransferase